jgi:hypothetical protein
MFQRPILMNEEGSSPGGGAPTPAPESPAANQGAPVAAPSITDIQSAVAAQLSDFKNGFFADLRKTGVLDKGKPSPTAPAAAPVPIEAPAAPASHGGMTAADVQTLMARDRAFHRVVATAGLTEEQFAFVEETRNAVNPPDPGAWASTFLKTMGLGHKPATQQAAPAPAAPAVAIPNPANNISDRGPATAGDVRDVKTYVQTRPLEMTSSDFERLQLKEGREKALQIVQESVNSHLRSIRLTPDRRR